MTTEKEQIEKLSALSGIIATRVNEGLHKLMGECMEDLMARKNEFPPTAKPPEGVTAEGAVYFTAVGIASSTIIAGLIRQLREAGCPDDVRKDIVDKAVALESRQATS